MLSGLRLGLFVPTRMPISRPEIGTIPRWMMYDLRRTARTGILVLLNDGVAIKEIVCRSGRSRGTVRRGLGGERSECSGPGDVSEA